MSISITNFHVYQIPTVEGFPIYELQLTYRARPYCVLESATNPGTLTKHRESFPLQDKSKKVEQVFTDWLKEQSPEGSLQGLYEVYELQAVQDLSERAARYSGSLSHRADYRRTARQCYLTEPQLLALTRCALDFDPWEGTDDKARNEELERQEATLRQATQYELTEENVSRWLIDSKWQPDRKLEARMFTMDTGSSMIGSALIKKCKGRADQLAQSWVEVEKAMAQGQLYVPPLHLYLYMSEERRVRFCFELRKAPHGWLAEQAYFQPWESEESYYPQEDEEAFLAFAAEHPGHIPENIGRELGYGDEIDKLIQREESLR